MSDLIDTTEMFLKAIYELNEVGAPAMRARLTERLDQAMPSVSQTISRMTREGLVTLDDDRHVVLTELGSARATSVLRKHRMAERLLHDVLGLEWSKCHEEACRWEHVITDEAELLIAKQLTSLDTDPYGNPIPGLAALGLEADASPAPKTHLTDTGLDEGEEANFRVASIAEAAQARPEFLAQLRDAGIGIGGAVRCTRRRATYELRAGDAVVVLDRQLAEQFFVAV